MIIKCPICKARIETEDTERIEGMVAIRKYIDPEMSATTFYRKHRKGIEHALIKREHRFDGRGGVKRSYFTFKRLLIHYMLKRKTI
jgi:hypothetical protein